MTATTECSSCSTLAFPLLPRDSCIVSLGLLLLLCLLEVELCLPTSIMLGSSLKRSREDDFEDELFAHEPKVRPHVFHLERHVLQRTRCHSFALDTAKFLSFSL